MEHGQFLVNQQQSQCEWNTDQRKKPSGRTQTSAKGITSNVSQGHLIVSYILKQSTETCGKRNTFQQWVYSLKVGVLVVMVMVMTAASFPGLLLEWDKQSHDEHKRVKLQK